MERFTRRLGADRTGAALLVTLLLAACGGEEETADGASAPRISGSPPAVLAVGERYAFTPAVHHDAEPLTFSITGRPAWLTFDATSGSLTGTPSAADVGLYRGVTIEASDGRNTLRLAPFDVEVIAMGSRAATIAWRSPTENEDGSVLTNLAGFQIQYGRQPGRYSHSVSVRNPGITTYVVSGLVPGTYYFAMTAYNATNTRSLDSPEMTIVIR